MSYYPIATVLVLLYQPLSYYPTVLASYSLTVTLSQCHTVSYCPTVLVSHNYVLAVTLSQCPTVILFHCHTVPLSYCPIATILYSHTVFNPCKVHILCMHTNSSPLSNRIADSDIIRELLMLLVVACTLIAWLILQDIIMIRNTATAPCCIVYMLLPLIVHTAHRKNLHNTIVADSCTIKGSSIDKEDWISIQAILKKC